MADEIDLDLFSVFTVSSVSVLWEALDLSNDLPLFDLSLMDLYFLLLDACGLYVFFSGFVVFYVSVLWEALDLSNDIDLSNVITLFDSLLIDLYF